MNILIDPKNVARLMVEHGIKPSNIKAGDFEDYTDTLVDVLTEAYDLETAVTEALKTIKVCPECESVDWDWQNDIKICNNCHLEF